MDLGFVFRMSLYGLTALVGAILGCAESEGVAYGTERLGFALPFLSIPVVVCGYLFTEIHWRRGRSGFEFFQREFPGDRCFDCHRCRVYERESRRKTARRNTLVVVRDVDCSLSAKNRQALLVFNGTGNTSTCISFRFDD